MNSKYKREEMGKKHCSQLLSTCPRGYVQQTQNGEDSSLYALPDFNHEGKDTFLVGSSQNTWK